MLNVELDPAVLASKASGFRFPPKTPFYTDLSTTEIRLVIIGWLAQAEQLAKGSNGGVQELRDAIFRLEELIVGLSIRHLTIYKDEQEKSRPSQVGSDDHAKNGHRPPDIEATAVAEISQEEETR